MNNALNKKLAELIGKMDEKVLQARLNAAVEMLKKGNAEELANKLNKMDKTELTNKINEFDESKLQDLNINLDQVKNKITSADLDRLSQLIGENGDEIVKKIKTLLSKS